MGLSPGQQPRGTPFDSIVRFRCVLSIPLSPEIGAYRILLSIRLGVASATSGIAIVVGLSYGLLGPYPSKWQKNPIRRTSKYIELACKAPNANARKQMNDDISESRTIGIFRGLPVVWPKGRCLGVPKQPPHSGPLGAPCHPLAPHPRPPLSPPRTSCLGKVVLLRFFLPRRRTLERAMGDMTGPSPICQCIVPGPGPRAKSAGQGHVGQTPGLSNV